MEELAALDRAKTLARRNGRAVRVSET